MKVLSTQKSSSMKAGQSLDKIKVTSGLLNGTAILVNRISVLVFVNQGNKRPEMSGFLHRISSLPFHHQMRTEMRCKTPVLHLWLEDGYRLKPCLCWFQCQHYQARKASEVLYENPMFSEAVQSLVHQEIFFNHIRFFLGMNCILKNSSLILESLAIDLPQLVN